MTADEYTNGQDIEVLDCNGKHWLPGTFDKTLNETFVRVWIDYPVAGGARCTAIRGRKEIRPPVEHSP